MHADARRLEHGVYVPGGRLQYLLCQSVSRSMRLESEWTNAWRVHGSADDHIDDDDDHDE